MSKNMTSFALCFTLYLCVDLSFVRPIRAFSFTQNTKDASKVVFSPLEKFDRFLTRLQDPSEQLEQHTYLSGNYAPVSEEHVQIPVEVVEGAIPPHIDGMFCRNGPNPVTTRPLRKRYHWFDGHAMLHNLRLRNETATYTNVFVPSVRYRIEEELNEELFPTLGEYTGPLGLAKVLFHPSMVRRRIPDLKTVLPPNTNVLMYNDKFYCLNEGNLPFECRLLPDGALEPVGYETFDGALDYPVSAHPRVDANNDLLFHSYTTNTELIGRDGTMKMGRYSSEEKRVVSYFVPNDSKDYVPFAHGMVFTGNYSIVWDCSVHFDATAMFDGGSYFRTKEKYNLRFGVAPKSATSGDEVVWIDTGEPGAVVHPLNAWEVEEDEDGDGDVVIKIWTPFCARLEIDLETDDVNEFQMVEYELRPSTGGCVKNLVDDEVNVEFSAVPCMGTFNRFGYTAIQDKDTPGEGSFSGFCVWDMSSSSPQRDNDDDHLDDKKRPVYYDEHEVGGEPMLLRDDVNDTTYVGTHVYNMKEEQSYFLLYDGETTDLVCRLRMPHRVPFGFHGDWISGDKLRSHFEHHGLSEDVPNDSLTKS